MFAALEGIRVRSVVRLCLVVLIILLTVDVTQESSCD